jgi:hypothetical protein
MTSKRKLEVFTQEKPDDCVICTEKMNENKPLHCGHWIHYGCVQKQFKAECPVCRSPLDIEVKGSRPSAEVVNVVQLVGDVVERWFEDDEDTVAPEPRPLNRVEEMLIQIHGYIPQLLYTEDSPRDNESEADEGYNEEDYDEENPSGDSVYYD